MECRHCGTEINPKDKFCRKCGKPLNNDVQNASRYEDEFRQFGKEQDELRSLERDIESPDLSNPISILKAQLKLLISISKRMDRLEAKDNQRVNVIDFDMPFWSMVNFEFKALLVGLFIVFVFSCLFSLLFSSLFKDLFLPFLQQTFLI